ncbi:hypothetical protein C8R43DRAFT_1138924 [Mycena crocata]|nr:hypothetical protein C8R43DRAFT_1138924 [Mycena crocata]
MPDSTQLEITHLIVRLGFREISPECRLSANPMAPVACGISHILAKTLVRSFGSPASGPEWPCNPSDTLFNLLLVRAGCLRFNRSRPVPEHACMFKISSRFIAFPRPSIHFHWMRRQLAEVSHLCTFYSAAPCASPALRAAPQNLNYIFGVPASGDLRQRSANACALPRSRHPHTTLQRHAPPPFKFRLNFSRSREQACAFNRISPPSRPRPELSIIYFEFP